MNCELKLSLSREDVTRLKKLMKQVDYTAYEQIVWRSLTLFEWAVRERKAGRTIASVDEKNKRYREVLFL